jgi:hypothetical protein
MKLEIELYRYHCIVFGKILKMDESLRTKSQYNGLVAMKDGDDFHITSTDKPSVSSKGLFIRGRDRKFDDRPFSRNFTEETAALEWIERITDLIDRINRDSDTKQDRYPIQKIL